MGASGVAVGAGVGVDVSVGVMVGEMKVILGIKVGDVVDEPLSFGADGLSFNVQAASKPTAQTHSTAMQK